MSSTRIFSFSVKGRYAFDIVNKIVSSLGFKKRNVWKYNPYHLVLNQWVAKESFVYMHHANPKIEMMANKDTWEEVQHSIKMQVASRSLKNRELMEENRAMVSKNVVDS
jgi:hypothetical protein